MVASKMDDGVVAHRNIPTTGLVGKRPLACVFLQEGRNWGGMVYAENPKSFEEITTSWVVGMAR